MTDNNPEINDTVKSSGDIEIEITPEMIEAGAEVVSGWDDRFEDSYSIAYHVFLAMMDVRASTFD